MEELARRAHESYLQRVLGYGWNLDVEGRDAVIRGWGGQFELRFSRRLLREHDAMERVGISRAVRQQDG